MTTLGTRAQKGDTARPSSSPRRFNCFVSITRESCDEAEWIAQADDGL